MKLIRILYVNGGLLDRGGISNYMLNYYRHLDKNKVQIDFVVHGFEKGIYDDEIIDNGGKIYNIPIKSHDFFGNIKALRRIFSSGKYDIVHSHMDAMNWIVLREAKRSGIPIRISHAHSTKHYTNNKMKFFLNDLARRRIKVNATDLWACSSESGEWLYGRNLLREVSIINNAIDIDKFQFNKEIRNRLRRKLGLENKLVIGHVGNFNHIKNHEFIIRVFKKVYEANRNSSLVLVGVGDNQEKIRKLVCDYGLDGVVLFLNGRDDVNKLMQAFDVFILPSLFEGLPIVAIEAQCAGLKCIFSNSITKEVSINSEQVIFLPIDQNDESLWSEKILENKIHTQRYKLIDNNLWEDYDVKVQTKKLEDLYISIYKRGR